MSRVFVAEERELRRRVVIKVLPPELAAGINTDRFRREVQLAASLQHPHIVPLFAAGSAHDLLYYTMPFVKGESLRERLARERELPIADAVRILRDVVDALAYAHGEGVVHRDIKPANVLLSGGHALVTDFGVAKAISDAAHESTLTSAGVALGTPVYMAPEQAVADPHADHRVDIYAVGTLAYEMLTGLPPFSGTSPQQMLAAQVTEPPEPILKRRAAIPPALAAAVMRCLEKRPADRWQTAEQLLHQLEALATPSGGTAPHPQVSLPSDVAPAEVAAPTVISVASTKYPKARVRLGRALMIGGAVALAFAAGYATLTRRHAASAPAEGVERKALVVLPFENLGAAADNYFADGITEEITSRLAAVPGLKVTSRTTAMQYKETKKSVRQIGQELAAAYVLEGSVRWEKTGAQNRIRVTPQLIRVSDDSHVWADRYDAVLAEVFDVQSSIAQQVVGALGVALGEPAKQALTVRPTANTEAYDYYLRARETWNRGFIDERDTRAAVQALDRAVALDSTFAAAWALLSRSHAFIYWQHWEWTQQRLERARLAVEHASALQPDAPETRLARGFYRYWGFRDYTAAREEFEAALRSRPEDADIVQAIGLLQRRQGHWTEALNTLEHATDLEPRSVDNAIETAETACLMRRFSECARLADRIIRIAPELVGGYFFRAIPEMQSRGDVTAALRILHEGLERSDRQRLLAIAWWFFVALGLPEDRRAVLDLPLSAYASDTIGYYMAQAEARRFNGDAVRARAYYNSLRAFTAEKVQQRPSDDVSHAMLGYAYAHLGRPADAVREGRRAVELLPLSRDAYEGANRLQDLAMIYATIGDRDGAIDQLRILLEIPSRVSPGDLRVDPTWGLLRNDPRFQQLADQSLPTDAH
jgi:TolB-like protein